MSIKVHFFHWFSQQMTSSYHRSVPRNTHQRQIIEVNETTADVDNEFAV
jgi:hypothetical protein